MNDRPFWQRFPRALWIGGATLASVGLFSIWLGQTAAQSRVPAQTAHTGEFRTTPTEVQSKAGADETGVAENIESAESQPAESTSAEPAYEPAFSAKGTFVISNMESASGDVAIDEDQALHAAFSGYDGASKDTVQYGYCEAENCGDAAAWKTVSIPLKSASTAQIEVTPDGHPRIFVTGWSPDHANGTDYFYGECNADCLEEANWQFSKIASSADGIFSNIFRYRLPIRNFSLDHEGKPRFVYTDENYLVEPDHYGAFYMVCDDDCTEPSNWRETNLAYHIAESYRTESFSQPVLAIAPGGKVRVLASVYAFEKDGSDAPDALYYYACDSDCEDRDSWVRADVLGTGGGSYPNPTWDLDLLPDGRPRIVLFAGHGMEQADLSHQLIYAWCDADCGDDANWFGSTVQPGEGHGESPDLELTPEGKPRIAFLSGGGELAYSICNIDCETDHPQWRSDLVESTSVPQTERPQALPFHCDGEVWNGFMPKLALSGERAHIAYDLTVEARCLYKDYEDPIPSATFHEIFRGSRVVSMFMS